LCCFVLLRGGFVPHNAIMCCGGVYRASHHHRLRLRPCHGRWTCGGVRFALRATSRHCPRLSGIIPGTRCGVWHPLCYRVTCTHMPSVHTRQCPLG
jgi:hypothetical protein